MISDYIHDLNKAGELKSWSVAAMSPKTGEAIDLGATRKIFKVDRSIVKKAKSDRDQDALHIKVITAPRDELVDLKDVLPGEPVRNTDEIFVNEPGLTEVYLRQNIRPKDRGLILLYALNPNLQMTAEEEQAYLESSSQTMPIKAVGDAIGVAFVFPKTSSSKGIYRYIVNGTV
jgi:hypothetical protein